MKYRIRRIIGWRVIDEYNNQQSPDFLFKKEAEDWVKEQQATNKEGT